MGSKWGLVHYSQICEKSGGEKVEVEDEVELGQEVWVKVLSVDVEAQKVGMSMKYVDQATGEDKDMLQVKYTVEKESEGKRRGFGGGGGGGGGGRGMNDIYARNKREEEEYASHSWGGGGRPGGAGEAAEEEGDPEERNFGLSGLLAKETRTFEGVELKFIEPAEARMPTLRWRLYEFKGDEQTRTLHLHRLSCYVFGRDRSLNKFPGFVATDHPSCSKQHAVIQFRLQARDDGQGGSIQEVKPYVLDLQSTNGTHLNGERIEDQRYYELKMKDMIKFGNSTREYIVMHDGPIDAQGV
jgi:hypothetical protein